MNGKFFLVFILLLFAGALLSAFFVSPSGGTQESCPLSREETTLSYKGEILTVEVVRTPEAKHCGLSFREVLPPRRGMLFVFEEAGYHGIWMKDMRFPIDIAWLSEDLTLIDSIEGASPDSFPEVFYPKEEALYVLEVGSGTLEEIGLQAGGRLEEE